MTGEATSRAFLGLPGRQQELLEKIVATGKPVVLVLFSGRPADAALGVRACSGGAGGMAPGHPGGPRSGAHALWRVESHREAGRELAPQRGAGTALLQRAQYGAPGKQEGSDESSRRRHRYVRFALHRRAERSAVSVWSRPFLHHVPLRLDRDRRGSAEGLRTDASSFRQEQDRVDGQLPTSRTRARVRAKRLFNSMSGSWERAWLSRFAH